MAILWVLQPIPIAATSLVPLAAYPLLGIQTAADVSRSYIDANVFLFFGGFVVALGLEKWGLHRRMALHVVHAIGSSPRRIVLGVMSATAFLSMWISNTATTMLMLPIALALLRTLEEVEGPASPSGAQDPRQKRMLAHLGVALMLGIAYSASCGGFATLVGTPTNVAFVGQWGALFPGAPQPSMGQWVLAFFPLSVALLAVSFVGLTWQLPSQMGDAGLGRALFKERLRALGRPSAGEWAMLIIFVATAALWIFREPLEFQSAGGKEPLTVFPGWSPAYERFLVEYLGTDPAIAHGAIHDGTVAMLMAVLMFVIRVPTRLHGWTPLMDWTSVEVGMPWGILLLIGGGFAMASAFSSTGLSAWLGTLLADSLAGAPLLIVVASICALMIFLTEFTSNVATASTFLPILAGAAVTLEYDPRLLMLPATVAASCGFMLPVGTPPNAIVFASGRVTTGHMLRHGLLLNIVSVFLITAVTFLLVIPLMGISLGEMPEWARMPTTP
jgi:sodium-dependent dicarboxylate transporter 2/3/5